MKTIHKNMLQGYLEEFISLLDNRDIVILGCRGVSAVVYCALKSMGYDILYFLDPDSKYDKDHGGKTFFFGKDVFSCNQLLYEDLDKIAVLNTYHYLDRIEHILISYGLVENENYYNIHGCLKSKYCDVFDPILGYSRMDDMQGVKVFGEESNDAVKIFALGGSTTDYSYSDIKSWPEILHKLLNDKGIKNVVLNGGVCGYSSCQERDKFIRDVLGTKPDIVLSLTGVNDINWTLINKENPYYSDYFVNKMVKSICDRTNGGSDSDRLRLGIDAQRTDYENWLYNEKIIHGVAKEFGIKFYAFLQPFIFESKYEMSEFEKQWMSLFLEYGLEEHNAMKLIYEGYSQFYKGAKEISKNEEYIVDITNVFDNHVGVYTDGVHCDYDGNKLIAECILQKLLEEGELG